MRSMSDKKYNARYPKNYYLGEGIVEDGASSKETGQKELNAFPVCL
jgi:hypothetical protein